MWNVALWKYFLTQDLRIGIIYNLLSPGVKYMHFSLHVVSFPCKSPKQKCRVKMPREQSKYNKIRKREVKKK